MFAHLGLAVGPVVRSTRSEEVVVPGSLIRLTLDTTDPLAFGMSGQGTAMFVRSQVFEAVPAASEAERRPRRRVDVVAR